MDIRTGQTVYEQIMSLDQDNNPVSGATFDTQIYKDGLVYTGVSVSMLLSDDVRGVFTASWSADTIGYYQLYVKNNSTNVIFVSDSYNVRPDSFFDTTIFVGL
jgi:hypothetical protein